VCGCTVNAGAFEDGKLVGVSTALVDILSRISATGGLGFLLTLGALVGDAVFGTWVGNAVFGTSVGNAIGFLLILGTPVGNAVGSLLTVGISVGNAVIGAAVGNAVGLLLTLDTSVGNAVGTPSILLDATSVSSHQIRF